MDLTDVLYIIAGTLEVKRTDDGQYEAVLYDNIHDPCMLQGEGLYPEPDSNWKYATARAMAGTKQDAMKKLAQRIAGNKLGYDWPAMWTSSTEWMRLPPWLVAGTPTITERRKEPEQDETPPSAA